MNSYTIGAKKFTILCDLNDIGVVASTGIPYCRNLVDIYTEFCSHKKILSHLKQTAPIAVYKAPFKCRHTRAKSKVCFNS
jgi:hypothetical protein